MKKGIKILFFNPEQYVSFEDEPNNYELRLPILKCGEAICHRDYIYQRVLREEGRPAMNRKALQEVLEFKPDLVIYSTTWPQDLLDVDLLREIMRLGIPLYTHLWDTPIEPSPHQMELFWNCTYFGIWDSVTNFYRYRAMAERNPLGPKGILFSAGHNVLTDFFIRKEGVEKLYDVTILGSNEGLRSELTRYLAENLAPMGISFRKFGGLVDSERGVPIQGLTDRWVSWERYVEIINQSKICISSQTDTARYQIKGKVFHFLSCGTLCLSDANSELRRIVPEDCIVYYEALKDCLEKAVYYLRHEEEGRRIADNGYRWFHQTFDYKKFWSQFLRAVVYGEGSLPTFEPQGGQKENPLSYTPPSVDLSSLQASPGEFSSIRSAEAQRPVGTKSELKLNFITNQFDCMDALILARLVEACAQPGMIAFELGSYTGRSSLVMAPFICQRGGRLFCVDWFQGSPNVKDPITESFKENNILEVLRDNIKKAGFEGDVSILVGTTESISVIVADEIADFIFIDADHRYSQVRSDILNWYPKLKQGGIICGHDFDKHLRECDALRVLENCEEDFVDGCHYGVIRAVCEIFPEVQWEGRIWYYQKGVDRQPFLRLRPFSLPKEFDRNLWRALFPGRLDSIFISVVEEGYKGYNLLETVSQCYALAQSLGRVDLAQVSDEDWERWQQDNKIFIGESPGEVKSLVDRSGCVATMMMIEMGYKGYNIAHYFDSYYALAHSIDAIDLALVSEESLENMKREGKIIVGKTVNGVKTLIADHLKQKASLLAGTEVRPILVGLMQLIQSLITQGDLHKAEKLSAEGLKQFGHDPYAWVLRAKVLRRMHRPEDALDAIQQSLEREETVEGLLELIQIARALGREDYVREIVNYLSERYPDWLKKSGPLVPSYAQ